MLLLRPLAFFLAVAFTLTTPAKTPAEATEIAAGGSVMQCMANCIRHEGDTDSAKAACKLRCANVANHPTSGGQKRDCMGVYKACSRACSKADKACLRGCKKRLMNCS